MIIALTMALIDIVMLILMIRFFVRARKFKKHAMMNLLYHPPRDGE